MELLRFDKEVLCSCFIFDPVNNKELFNQLESAKVFIRIILMLLMMETNPPISSDVYLIFSFILSAGFTTSFRQ